MCEPATPGRTVFSPESGNSLEGLFDSDRFVRQVALAVERLAAHLGRKSIRGLALTDPAVILATAAKLTQGGVPDDTVRQDQKLAEIIEVFLQSGIQVYSPGYMGRQFSGPFPLTAVVEMVSAIATQPRLSTRRDRFPL